MDMMTNLTPEYTGNPGTPKTTKISNPDAELFVARDATESCGAVSYWRASGDVSIEALRTAWIDAGLDEKLLRKAPDAQSVLRRAVMQQQGRHRLVRGLKARGEFAIVDEHVVEVKEGEPAVPPTYTTLCIVSGNSDNFKVVRVDAPATEQEKFADTIEAACQIQQNVYDPSDVTGWLVSLAYKNGAVTLRDSGGVYFIPKDAMDFWNRAATVVESVTNKSHRVFRIPAMRNNEAMAAIIDAITHEAEQLVAAVEQEMTATGDDALGKRALKTRQAEAEAMLKKVEAYEKLVDQQLIVRGRVEGLQAAIVAVALTGEEG
jgi:hypothetical protein